MKDQLKIYAKQYFDEKYGKDAFPATASKTIVTELAKVMGITPKQYLLKNGFKFTDESNFSDQLLNYDP